MRKVLVVFAWLARTGRGDLLRQGEAHLMRDVEKPRSCGNCRQILMRVEVRLERFFFFAVLLRDLVSRRPVGQQMVAVLAEGDPSRVF